MREEMTQRREIWYTVKCKVASETDVLARRYKYLFDTPVNIVTVEWTLNALSRRRPHARAERSLSLCRSLFILRKVPWPSPLLHIQTLPPRHTTHLHLTSLPYPLTSIQTWLPTFRQLPANCRPVSTRSRADKVRAHRIEHSCIIFIRANHFLSRANAQGSGGQPRLLPRTPPDRQHR